MSTLSGNPHADQAMEYSAEASMINAWPTGERQILAMQAQAHATLTLGHEQRTANLIALSEALIGNPGFQETRSATFDVIYERLGLVQPKRTAKA